MEQKNKLQQILRTSGHQPDKPNKEIPTRQAEDNNNNSEENNNMETAHQRTTVPDNNAKDLPGGPTNKKPT